VILNEPNEKKIALDQAEKIANECLERLTPHCERIAIAGSIRRKKEFVKDIEIVAIPKPYGIGLFESGIAAEVNQWEKVKGDLPCKYTQRILPQGVKLDLFFASPINWGWIYAVRTGSAKFSKRLAMHLPFAGLVAVDGKLYRDQEVVRVSEEEDLFELLSIRFVEPSKR
jgi:DNA polymerase/3'-5' exonuclease PolX